MRDERFKLIASARPHTEHLIAHSYLDESHPFFVVTGAKAADCGNLAPHVRTAWDRWLLPPQYELYDLEADPYEWHDLADDPQQAEVKSRLIAALIEKQKEMRDPFLDPANVEAFVENQLSNRDLSYRKDKDFRWPYLDAFPKWRGRETGSKK